MRVVLLYSVFEATSTTRFLVAGKDSIKCLVSFLCLFVSITILFYNISLCASPSLSLSRMFLSHMDIIEGPGLLKWTLVSFTSNTPQKRANEERTLNRKKKTEKKKKRISSGLACY